MRTHDNDASSFARHRRCGRQDHRQRFARRFVAHSDGWEQDDACELWNVNLRKWQPATVKTLETKASDAWRGVAWRGAVRRDAARRGALR